MNQPKFSFNDYLKPINETVLLARKPIAIYVREGSFYYSFNETEIGWEESYLELCQEPQKKNLCTKTLRHQLSAIQWITANAQFNKKQHIQLGDAIAGFSDCIDELDRLYLKE